MTTATTDPAGKPKVWMFLASKYQFTRAGLESLLDDIHTAGYGAKFLRSLGYCSSNDAKRLSQYLKELQDSFRQPQPRPPAADTNS